MRLQSNLRVKCLAFKSREWDKSNHMLNGAVSLGFYDTQSFRQAKSQENFPRGDFLVFFFLADTHMGGHITKYLTRCLFMLVGIIIAVDFWYFCPYVFVPRRDFIFSLLFKKRNLRRAIQVSSLLQICFKFVAIIFSFQRNSHGNRKLLSSSNNTFFNLFKFSVIERVILVKV